MTDLPSPPGAADTIVLRPKFTHRRFWRWSGQLQPIVILLASAGAILSLIGTGWDRDSASLVGGAVLLASLPIMYLLLSRMGLVLSGDSLSVQDFLRSDLTVRLSSVTRVLVTTTAYPVGSRTVYVLVDERDTTVAVVPERLFEASALTALLHRLPTPEPAGSLSLRELRRRYARAARISPRLIGLLAVDYLLTISGVVAIVVSVGLPYHHHGSP